MSQKSGEEWVQIEKWIATNAKPLHKSLKPADGDPDVEKVEKAIGHQVVPSLRRLYGRYAKATRLFPGHERRAMAFSLIPLRSMAKIYKSELAAGRDVNGSDVESDGQIRAEYWNPMWFPFATNGGGDYLCVDQAPSQMGFEGQVIEVLHEGLARVFRATSLDGLAKQICSELAAGRCWFDREDGLVHAGDTGEGVATAKAIRTSGTFRRVKVTKSDVEYWVKPIESYERWEAEEAPKSEILDSRLSRDAAPE